MVWNLQEKFFVLQPQQQAQWPLWKRLVHSLWRAVGLVCAGVLLGYQLLGLAYGQYSWEAFLGYKASVPVMVLNILPVVWLLFLFYGLTGRAWLAYLLGGGGAVVLSAANFYKLSFRDDPLFFEDMLNIREAGNMATAQSYDLFFDRRLGISLLCLAVGTAILLILARGKVRGWKPRLAMTAAAVLAAAALWGVYLDPVRYEQDCNFDYLNQWSPTQNYVAHGFFYPFIHSAADFVDIPPEGYDRRQAQALLARYQDVDIPADKRVNIISIMREAYIDFSQYGIQGLDTSGYELFHRLKEESYHGRLFTNIFAGGTVDSERSFLTGSYAPDNYRGRTNSYLWYLRDQGYTVEGSHPYYKWFYNRQNINGYLGFESYRFLEDDYGLLSEASYPEDSVLYREIYRDYVDNKATGKPYFSFVLNVQSHGPYDTTAYGGQREYLTGDYSQECKNAMNNYMAAIMDGDVELMKLIDELRTDSEPVVLILFSDHMPWMGDGNAFYAEMGFDFETGDEASLRSYYETEYLIWANDAAKALLGREFVGEGPTISPCFLMNEAFSQCGYTGPGFMQAMDELRRTFSVVASTGCYVVDGQFWRVVPEEHRALFQQFEHLQYLWGDRFIYG